MKDEAAAAKLGTSLEVLAPFLPYGIKVQTNWRDGPRIGQLSSLNYHQNCVGVKLHGENELQTMLVLELCQPVLRPFSALCTPLADGTIPAAIEFVRSFLSGQDSMDWKGAHIERVYENGDIMVCIPDRRPQRYDHSYILHHDWGCLPLEAYSWLAKNHFALPVNGRPLLEGVDFIAKTAAAIT